MAGPTRSANSRGRRDGRIHPAVPALLALAVGLAPPAARAATFAVCRTIDLSGRATPAVLVPAGSLFRDDGRMDDPLRAFTRDYWQLRLETIADVIIAPLDQCTVAFVRVTSDSAVKSVSAGDNRRFVYSGSSNLIDPTPPSEALLSLTGLVLDRVP